MGTRQKFASQADAALLTAVREIAAAEGQQFQSVIEEALSDWLARKRGETVRPDVMAHLAATMERNAELYRRLAQ